MAEDREVLYDGPRLAAGSVSLERPDVGAMRRLQPEPFEWGRWLEQAIADDAIVYFAIKVDNAVAGEIFVHDIAENGCEAMLGYHIFDPTRRGQGTGRASLTLLLNWIQSQSSIRRLYVTTAEDNIPSRRLLEGAGMKWIGRPHEDASRVLYLWESSLDG